jgi:hypothetical protein
VARHDNDEDEEQVFSLFQSLPLLCWPASAFLLPPFFDPRGELSSRPCRDHSFTQLSLFHAFVLFSLPLMIHCLAVLPFSISWEQGYVFFIYLPHLPNRILTHHPSQ